LEIASSGDNWSVDICEAIEALWGDEVIQTMFLGPRGNELNESSRYFFENLERYRDPDMYTPTAQDVLRARVRSTGIEEAEFKFDELKFRMFDVGGQVDWGFLFLLLSDVLRSGVSGVSGFTVSTV
jgi:guanine nucleotide-binding protein subunit alpha